jgi:hypothetical protein
LEREFKLYRKMKRFCTWLTLAKAKGESSNLDARDANVEVTSIYYMWPDVPAI